MILILEAGDFANETNVLQILSLEFKSRFEVGSSIISNNGLPTIAIAIESFLRPPYERFYERVSMFSLRQILSKIL